MNDRYNIHNQVELLQMKYAGTGHADINKWEWNNNMQRDTLSSHLGNHSRLVYFGVCDNLSVSKLKNNFLNKMIQPTGKNPEFKNNMNIE